jgi:formate hydrogenlyase subunit 6/NADH:ubiquinone oxidoreductase subunit I
MLCSTICPNDALSSSFDILALVINHPQSDAVTYTCHLQQQYIDNEVVLPCLAALSAEALLYLCLAEKSSPILLDAKHCSNCHNQKSFQIFKQILDKVSHIIKELANSPLVLQTEERGKPEPSTRRVFLKSIKNVISTQKRNQHKTCTEEDGPSSSRRAITIKTTLVNAAANHVSPSQRAYFSRHAKSSVIVNGKCTPCNRCSGICPTGALELIRVGEVKNVVFGYKKCSGCGLCVAFCKLEALSLTASPISRLPLVPMEVQQS